MASKKRKQLMLLGGGGVLVVAVLVVVLVLVLGRSPAPAAATDIHETAQNFERALKAADVNALLAITHPDDRDTARADIDEVREELGDAEFREFLRQYGQAFADRELVYEDENEARFELQIEGWTETIEFIRKDGEWFLRGD